WRANTRRRCRWRRRSEPGEPAACDGRAGGVSPRSQARWGTAVTPGANAPGSPGSQGSTARRPAGRRCFLLVHRSGQLRLLPRRLVGMDDSLGGGLVELLRRQVVFHLQLVRRAGQRLLEALQVRADVLLRAAVAQPALLVLAEILLRALR